jgi:hypothetical protein
MFKTFRRHRKGEDGGQDYIHNESHFPCVVLVWDLSLTFRISMSDVSIQNATNSLVMST